MADLIYGFLSITLMILVIAFTPSLIEWMEGKSCWTFNAGNRIHNNMHRTFPPVYLGSAGQIFEPLTHSDPYHKAKANIPKKQKVENKCIHENTFTWFYIYFLCTLTEKIFVFFQLIICSIQLFYYFDCSKSLLSLCIGQ